MTDLPHITEDQRTTSSGGKTKTAVRPPTDEPVPPSLLDGAVEPYSRDKTYVITAAVLAAITAVEVATYVWPHFALWSWGSESNIGIITVLLVLMAVKFGIVAAVFMHLKFDKPILTRVFVSGLVLAVAVYVAVMFMFRMFFDGSQMVIH